MTALSRLPWLPLAALTALVVLAGTIAIGWDRSFWFDEVYSLGAAAIGRPLDWALLKTDVHPPGYTLAIRQLGAIFAGDSPALRSLNLVGLLALIAAIAVLWRPLGRDKALLLFAVIVVSGYGLQLSLDLRSYGLLLGLGALLQAIFLREVLTGRASAITMTLLTAALSALHYFGAALGLTVLGLSALRAIHQRRYGAAALLITAILGVMAAVLIYATQITNSGEKFVGGGNWIELGVDAFVDFAAEQLPLAVLILLLLIHRKAGSVDADKRAAARWMLAVPLIIVLVTGALSIVAPLISTRNLTVCVPGVAFAVVLLAPEPVMTFLRRSPVMVIVLLLAGLRYGDTGSRNFQMIEWAIETAAPPACDGATLYTLDPGNVSRFSQEVFLGAVKRPMEDLRTFEGTAALPDGCDILATGWHQTGTVDEVTTFFAQRGVETEAILPPDPRLRTGQMTHGYVIRLK